MSRERTKVTTFDGLWDEESLAESHHINRRKRWCFRHKWINASLYWQSAAKPDGSYYSIDVLSEKRANGGVRFCVNCKIVSCIHLFEETVYEIEDGPYYSREQIVGKCKRCGLRIFLGGCGNCKPKPEAMVLIEQVARELGKRPVSDMNSGYGSGFVCELPVAVSRIMDLAGEKAAKQYVRSCFNEHSVESAMDMVHGR